MKKIFLIPLVIVLVSGLILSGCAAPAPPPEEEVAPPAPPAPAPPVPPPEEEVVAVPTPPPEKYGGFLKVAGVVGPANLGYPVGMKGADFHFATPVLEHLLREGEGGTIGPHLATSWELAPDGKSYTFKLREGVKFHDGTEFNSTTVKYNLDIALNSPIPILVGVESVDVIDRHTVRLNFSECTNLILEDLASSVYCLIISTITLDKMGEDWVKTNPVGTGPWKFKEFVRGVSVTYERFDNYWGGAPYLDGFEIVLIPDATTALAAFKAGEIQTLAPGGKDASELAAEGYDISSIAGHYFILTPNSKDPESIFADKRVRQAVEYALDKEPMTEMLGYGYIDPIYQIVHSGPWHPDKVARKYDPDKARQLLAEAGYPDGFKTKIIAGTFMPADAPVALQSNLAEVGIDAELELVDRARYMNYRFQGGLGNNLLMDIIDTGSGPLSSANAHLSSTSALRPEVARPSGLDDLLDRALVELDPDKLTPLLQEIDQLVYDDAMVIPLWMMKSNTAFSPLLKGYKPFPWYSHFGDLSKAWLSEK